MIKTILNDDTFSTLYVYLLKYNISAILLLVLLTDISSFSLYFCLIP